MKTTRFAFSLGLLVSAAYCLLPPAYSREPERLPRTSPMEPAEALKSFRVLDGFRLDLLAAEPLVMDPVAAAYDEDGRLFVVEMTDYPHVEPANDR